MEAGVNGVPVKEISIRRFFKLGDANKSEQVIGHIRQVVQKKHQKIVQHGHTT